MSRAAEILSLNRSTVKRDVDKNPALIKGRKGRSVMISMTEYRLYRQSHLDPVKVGNHAGLEAKDQMIGCDGDLSSRDDVQAASIQDPAVGEDLPLEPAALSPLQEWRARDIEASARRKELQLARDAGELVEVTRVQEHIAMAFGEVASRLDRLPKTVSGDLATMTDRREIQVYLQERLGAMRTALAERLEKMSESDE